MTLGEIMDPHIIGATAAVITSALWTFNALLFTAAGKRIGSNSVNAIRIIIAVGLLALTHLILLGTLVPDASNEQWFWIGMSGIIGLGIGDSGLFAAFVIIGTRRSVLLMALSPIFAAFFAFFLMGEVLTVFIIIGIAITVTGVMIVILEREDKSDEMPLSKKRKRWGVFLGLVGAVGQGIGLAFVRKGMLLYPEAMRDSFGEFLSIALSATLIRMILGAIIIWVAIIIAGRLSEIRRARKESKALKCVVAGAFIGPFIGITLSNVAALLTETGVAQTLISLMPVMIIPVVWVLYRQRTSWRGIVGAIVAVVGVAMLFLLK